MADRPRVSEPTRPAAQRLDDPVGPAFLGSDVGASEHEAERVRLEQLLASEQARIKALELEKTAAAERLEAVSDRLRALGTNARAARATPTPSAPAATKLPNPRKLEIFRELFRGRDDVYAVRWENRKTGKSGYSPDCSNKWVDGVCDIKKIKCGACPNNAFKPVDDPALTFHLRGRHVMGVYPLLPNDSCWFLAIDFDENSWREDVSAVCDTCRRLGLPAYVERSRSGNGAHLWLFFTEPVQAAEARKLGCHVLTESMNRRPELSFRSYDRLFPSQDTMPEGGFGNLIALPLQLGARANGNSVFLDEDLEPYSDEQQWRVLASVERIPPEALARIVSEAARTGTILGVRSADVTDDEDSSAPWTRTPSRKRPKLRLASPLPDAIQVTLAQRLYIARAGLPPAFLNRMKRLAAFQNPEFYKRQRMRLSTAGTPRIICCAEDLPEHLALPRGCLAELEELAAENGIPVRTDDKRHDGARVEVAFGGKLTPLQEEAIEALSPHDIGVLVAPPGVGKTVIGTALVARRARNTLVLVHRLPLLEQWRAQLALFLGIDPKRIGQIGGGKRQPNGRLDVAMLQTLVRGDKVDDIVAEYGQVIVDECHHLPAVSFERVLAEVRGRYIVGLTATPRRRDGHHPITAMQLGPVRFEVSAKNQAAERPFRHKLIVRETGFQLAPKKEKASIAEIYGELVHDQGRNELILADIIATINEGRSPIVLTERKEHITFFAERLGLHSRNVVVLTGGMGIRQRREIGARMAAFKPNESRVVLATGRFIGEGFDDARLDTLFLTMPVSWAGVLTQYAGRLHRLHPHKEEVRILDYFDEQVPMLRRMFEKRLRGYRAIGYEQGEVPRGFELLADPDYLFDEGRDERYEDDDIAETDSFDDVVASGDG
jgi:superfamily II DNA or RNA helicase